ncbi:EamA family transporter [Rhodobacteraceae bacterium WD3A24]|nr:EamA family transporter [Rhodobacteraceae bacterium WD3A24]
MPQQDRPLLAALWMVGAIASFSMMAVSGRAIQEEFNTFQLMAWRSVIGWVVVVALVWRSPFGFAQLRTPRPWLHVQRNIFHFTGQNAWFFALTLIPLAQLVAFEFSNPVWVALLAPLLLGEALTRRRMIAVALGFAGILLVARPGLQPLSIGHASALLAALGFALNTLWTKRLMAYDSVLCVLFWMTASQAVMGFVLGLWGGFPWPTPGMWPWLIAVGVSGLTAHYCLTSALSVAQAGIVAPMEFMRLPALAAIGALLYAEPLEATVFLGAAVILAGNLVNMRAGPAAPAAAAGPRPRG